MDSLPYVPHTLPARFLYMCMRVIIYVLALFRAINCNIETEMNHIGQCGGVGRGIREHNFEEFGVLICVCVWLCTVRLKPFKVTRDRVRGGWNWWATYTYGREMLYFCVYLRCEYVQHINYLRACGFYTNSKKPSIWMIYTHRQLPLHPRLL